MTEQRYNMERSGYRRWATRLAGVAVLTQQPLLQVLQPLGVDGQLRAVLGHREQVHVADGLFLLRGTSGMKCSMSEVHGGTSHYGSLSSASSAPR